MTSSLIKTPFHENADAAANRAFENWQAGHYLASLDNALYARFAYLADVIASVVLLPLSLVGMAFGAVEALFRWNTEKAVLLQFSTLLLTEKIERFFASSLGAILSPAGAYYFSKRKITPMALGLVTMVALSYMIIKNNPGQFDWSFTLGH